MADSNGYLTLGEAAKIINVSRSLVYRMVEEGEIPCFRVRKRMIRFHRKDIDKWMNAHHKTGRVKNERNLA
jgi:excisionase family DNA binding protein